MLVHWGFLILAFFVGFFACWGLIRIAASATKSEFFNWLSGGK